MEIFGYLTFVGDVQNIPTQNSQYGNEPFLVREVCVHTFVPSSQNGELTTFMRGFPLRITGRQAETFSIAEGSLVAVECTANCRPYRDQRDGRWRVSGSLSVTRISEVIQHDLDQISRLIAQNQQLRNGSIMQ